MPSSSTLSRACIDAASDDEATTEGDGPGETRPGRPARRAASGRGSATLGCARAATAQATAIVELMARRIVPAIDRAAQRLTRSVPSPAPPPFHDDEHHQSEQQTTEIDRHMREI